MRILRYKIHDNNNRISSSSYSMYPAHRKTMDKVRGGKDGGNSYPQRRARPKESKIIKRSYTEKINEMHINKINK